MDWTNILNQIFELCIVPLLGLATGALVALIKAKIAQSKAKTENETLVIYLSILEQTVITCVQATNQTYVNTLKGQNAFDAEAQQRALQATYNQVLNILSKDAQTYLGKALGDFETYVKDKIEQAVLETK